MKWLMVAAIRGSDEKHTANHKQWIGSKFRTNDFTKHLQQQHAKWWEEYN
jgi:hypothetical protein